MGKKGSKRVQKGESDWIAALAKQTTTQESAAAVPSKAQRIERRNAKKRRRQERKPFNATHSLTINHDEEVHEQDHKRMNRSGKTYLSSIERVLEKRVTALHDKSSEPYQGEAIKKGKATSGYRLNDEMVQPRRRDYGGLGLARPSLFISLRDPSFIPKLEEFAEHVPGFFGKQRTKAMKKQLDGNMLWRQLAEKRSHDRKVGGKRLSVMSPDERVEAMLKAGMI